MHGRPLYYPYQTQHIWPPRHETGKSLVHNYCYWKQLLENGEVNYQVESLKCHVKDTIHT